MNNVIIFGANSFVGSHLIERLIVRSDISLTLVARVTSQKQLEEKYKNIPRLNMVFLNNFFLDDLKNLLISKNIIINLLYIEDSIDDNLNFSRRLKVAAITNGVRKLIHISTADIIGRNSDNNINELISPKPLSSYAVSKFKIEQEFLNNNNDDNLLDVVILRPTAIFGVGGKNMNKIISDLCFGNKFINYIKLCLYSNRNLNLVSVEKVVDACIFLMDIKIKVRNQIFFISDDDSNNNNFSFVVAAISSSFPINIIKIFPIYIPIMILKFLLFILGKNNINPLSSYSSSKLYSYGFTTSQNFEKNLQKYIISYHSILSSSSMKF